MMKRGEALCLSYFAAAVFEVVRVSRLNGWTEFYKKDWINFLILGWFEVIINFYILKGFTECLKRLFHS